MSVVQRVGHAGATHSAHGADQVADKAPEVVQGVSAFTA